MINFFVHGSFGFTIIINKGRLHFNASLIIINRMLLQSYTSTFNCSSDTLFAVMISILVPKIVYEGTDVTVIPNLDFAIATRQGKKR